MQTEINFLTQVSFPAKRGLTNVRTGPKRKSELQLFFSAYRPFACKLVSCILISGKFSSDYECDNDIFPALNIAKFLLQILASCSRHARLSTRFWKML